MKKSILALAVSAGLAITALAAGPAQAMGSGNNYADMQTGVTYTVYQPTYTNGLKQTSFGADVADASCNAEEYIATDYGNTNGKGRAFTIFEGNPICLDLGNGRDVYTTTIKGAKATITAYCPEEWKTCSAKDVAKYGGHLRVIFPSGGNGLRATQVWIDTLYGHSIGAKELVKIAQRMQPIG